MKTASKLEMPAQKGVLSREVLLYLHNHLYAGI